MTTKRDSTIEALLEGTDIIRLGPDNRDKARVFLHRVCEESVKIGSLGRLALPIARHLVAYPEWDTKVDVPYLLKFCADRYSFVESLDTMDRDAVDFQAEYMAGCGCLLALHFFGDDAPVMRAAVRPKAAETAMMR